MLACRGSGRTALWWACSRGFDDVAALLLQSQADARSTCTSGDTALQAAREAGSRKCIALLHVRLLGGLGLRGFMQSSRPFCVASDAHAMYGSGHVAFPSVTRGFSLPDSS